MRSWLAATAVTLLGGCTPHDDPDNIPERGHWESSLRLVALTIDDRAVTREEVPFALPPDKKEDRGCVEPRLKTMEEANATVANLSKVDCRFESLDLDGNAITGGGRCAPQAKAGVSVGATFTVNGDEAPARIHSLLELNAYAHLQDGQTVRVHTAHVIDWKRLSACAR
ncbi:MAG: hypothetical protein V4610_19380 [Pseudomonadota bacterium]|jgi:hypothetical protein|uniref:DUF3617 family protein n=1 Tax=hydrothermal vent metagenome TaxID=652676 RepID=A0A160TNH4_9ZZZZ